MFIFKIIAIICSQFLEHVIEFLLQTLEVFILKKLRIFTDFFLIFISKPIIDPDFYIVLCIFDIFHKILEINDCPVNVFLFNVIIFAEYLLHEKIEEDM